MKKSIIYLFTLGLFFITASNVSADGFVINLYYDTATKKLTFNNLTKNVVRNQNVDTSIVEFSKDETVGPYILKLYDSKGNEFSTSQFNKKDGAFKLVIPYFSIAAQLKIIEKATNKEILSADLKEYETCNGNGQCEDFLGETHLNCMDDCKPPTPPQNTTGDINNLFHPNPINNEEATPDKPLSLWERIVQFFRNLF